MKKWFYSLLVVVYCLVGIVNVNALDVTRIEQIKDNDEILNYEDIDSRSYLENNYRELGEFSDSNNSLKYYPRLKKINNYYILTYQSGKTGGNIYYTYSKDLKNWSSPTLIWENFNYYKK